ncbi:MAG: lysine--tRNA ligase, partial [Actinomycetota bacterium]|nr:lysine--tRNA ligase [Actinomycetota bacterium]
MTEEPRGRLAESIAARRQKVERLRQQGIEPFALKWNPDARLDEIRKQYEGLEPGRVTEDRYRVAGRIMLLRRQGKLTFATIRDASGELQLFLRENDLGDRYALVDDLDLGDIVGAAGPVMTTKKGELSIRVDELILLTKAMRPLPEKWHGLRDPEARVRRRYLDFTSNLESRRVVTARATVLGALRRELEGRGFVEVETPVLQPTHGGALARPFATRHRVLDTTLYLRIAPELYLKRLLVGGFERIYEVGRNFRNEGIDRDHNPEFTMLEAYQAYGDYEDMMDLDEALVKAAALAVRAALEFDFRGQRLDLSSPWRRVTLMDAISEGVGEDVSLDRKDLHSVAERAGVGVDPKWGPGKVLLEIYEKLVEGRIFQPTFVKDFPREVSPLARPHRSDPNFTEHFDLVIAGLEIGPAYSELTDPAEQRARFEAQHEVRKKGDEEAHPLDEDF